jgi:putative thiamine transport system ATP-binding protein
MALELSDVTIRVAGRTLIDALSARIAPGAVLAVMGASGSGKSSLLAWIAGTLEPPFEATGRLALDGRDLTALPIQQRRIGLLFQDDLLFPHLTVRDNLLFALPPGARADRVAPAGQPVGRPALARLAAARAARPAPGAAARRALLQTRHHAARADAQLHLRDPACAPGAGDPGHARRGRRSRRRARGEPRCLTASPRQP